LASWSNSFTQSKEPKMVAAVAVASRRRGCDEDISLATSAKEEVKSDDATALEVVDALLLLLLSSRFR